MPGPFGAGGILAPPGRYAQPSTSAFVATNGSPTLAPYLNPKPGYVQQWNLDIQRQLPAGFFADVAYAGAHGVHLQQYSTNVNQIPDSFVAEAGQQFAAGQAVSIAQPYVGRTGLPINPLSTPNATLSTPTILAGQLRSPVSPVHRIESGRLWMLWQHLQFTTGYPDSSIPRRRHAAGGLHQRKTADEHRYAHQLARRANGRRRAGAGL